MYIFHAQDYSRNVKNVGSMLGTPLKKTLILHTCKNGKPRKTCKCALCTVDDSCCFHDIRLGPKTSVYEKYVSVKSTVTGCVVTYCATTLQGFNKHASSRREAVSDSRGVPRCTEKISKNPPYPYPVTCTVTRRHCTIC